jgi:alpha-beta hydrolase superfamily lysophospholipase
VFSNGFFYELASLTDSVHRNLHALHQRLNLLYIAGDDDPVVGKAKGFRKNAKALRKYVPQLETRLYTGGRHELLNDQCRADVVTDCINFIDRSL